MKLSLVRSSLFVLFCSSGLLRADIVTLKDGRKLEGNILSETPAAIRMRYRLTPKIWDEKDIPRTDIAEGGILKQKPEEVEIIELRKLVPTPDLFSAEKYEQLIQDRLRPFVNRYPGTPEAAEVSKMIDTVQEEKEKVVAGGAKLEGKWLSPDEAKAESLNIKAYALRTAMNEKAEARDYNGALKEFEKMADPRSGMIASIYYPKAVEEAVAILTKYDAQLNQMIKDQPALERMREESIKKLIEPDLSRMKEAITREKEQWKNTSDAERRTSPRWFTPYKYDMASLKTLSKNVTDEKIRLGELDIAGLTKVNTVVADLLRADAKAASDAEALKKMGEAIVAGETAAAALDAGSRQFYQTVFQAYRERYAYAQQQLAMLSVSNTSESPAVGATAGSSAISGNATPGVDERMAAALAAASTGGTPAATGQAPVAGVPAAAAPAAIDPATGMPVQPGAVPVAAGQTVGQPGYPQQQQPGYAQQQTAYAQQPMIQPGSQEAPAEEDEGVSTNTLLLIGMGVVLLVLVVAMLGGKKKK